MEPLMNLMIQCTNAIIATVSAVGMLIFTLGVVVMGYEMTKIARALEHWGVMKAPMRVTFIAQLILLVAGMVVIALIVT